MPMTTEDIQVVTDYITEVFDRFMGCMDLLVESLDRIIDIATDIVADALHKMAPRKMHPKDKPYRLCTPVIDKRIRPPKIRSTI
jgi:hypothetical protein